jgi:hypothetical protein
MDGAREWHGMDARWQREGLDFLSHFFAGFDHSFEEHRQKVALTSLNRKQRRI